MLKALNKYRRVGTVGMLGLLIVIAFIVSFINSSYGIPLSSGGLMVLLAMALLAAVVAVGFMIVDIGPNNVGAFKKLFLVAMGVLVMVSLVTPIVQWISGMLGILVVGSTINLPI